MKPSPSLKKQLDSLPLRAVSFIEPMECLAVSKLHDGPQSLYEVKLDCYRALGIKSNGSVRLLSRRNNSFNRQYPLIVEALAELPEDTVVDGEVVALDASGFPNFNLLQNYRTEASRIHFFVFDLLVYQGRDLTRLPLIERQEIMRSTADGVITRIDIERKYSGGSTSGYYFSATFTYDFYDSPGHRMAGSWYKNFSTEAEARAFADRELPIDKKVVVRFNQKNPELNNLELDSWTYTGDRPTSLSV